MIMGKDTFQHTRACGADLFGSISAAMPGLLLVKHVSSVETDLLGSTYGSNDLDFTPEARETDFFFFKIVRLVRLSFTTTTPTKSR